LPRPCDNSFSRPDRHLIVPQLASLRSAAVPPAFGLLTHQAPQCLDVIPLRRLGTDRHPHHPPAVERGRREVCPPRAVHTLSPGQRVPVQFLPLQTGRLVADADRLKRQRGQNPPAPPAPHPFGPPRRGGHVPPQPCPQG